MYMRVAKCLTFSVLMYICMQVVNVYAICKKFYIIYRCKCLIINTI